MFITALYLYVAAHTGLAVTLPPIVGTVLIDLFYLSVLRTAIRGRFGMDDSDGDDEEELVDDEWDDPV